MSSGHQDIKDVMRDVRDIIGDVREDFGEDGDDMSSLSSSRCQGRHVFPVFPIFPNLLGKTCLPHLPLRCWGRHVFPVFPEMLGKTLGDVGEDKNIGENTQDCRGGHQGGRGMMRKTLGDNGDVREGFNLLPEVPAAMGDIVDVREDTRG